jgi:tetratricopeptide (TPR) repeat protein
VPVSFPRVAAALGVAYAQTGRVIEAVALHTQALAQTMATAMCLFEVFCCLALAEAQMLAGRLGEARLLAERALALARQYPERGHEAYALHLLGTLAAQPQPPDVIRAATHYHRALTLAEELGMRPLQAHCHRSLGTLSITLKQAARARSELAMAIEMYQAMDMTFWLPETEAALARVDGP